MTDPSPARNPLLDPAFRIPFHQIRAEHVGPGVREALADARSEVEALASSEEPLLWETTVEPLDALMERLHHRTTPVHHLLAVAETPELREAWGDLLPEVSSFWSTLFLDEGLWSRVRRYAETSEARRLEGLRKRHLDCTLRDFRRSGADLDPAGRRRLEAIEGELAQLQQSFSENVLDATAAFTLHVTEANRLRGVPEDALERFRQKAEGQGTPGWILTLDHPSFEAVLRYAEDRALRAELHGAFFARARIAPWDNGPLIPKILELRREKAELLGYADFPDYRLEEQMVRSGRKARDFVAEVVGRTRPYWERDLGELQAHARTLGIESLGPWDVAFVSERLRRHRFDIDEEELRPYFPLDSVLKGLFETTGRLFGLRVVEREVVEVWHPDVRYFELSDEDGKLLGGFYIDLFPRPNKREGGWMNDLGYGIGKADGSVSPHLGVICANFAPASKDRPPLLTHRDVQTLFHEFGHLLHHITSRVPISRRGGVSVAWDWVELPSQLLENWTWEKDSLDLFARHWQTGEVLPDRLLQRMLRARRFMGGWQQMRQLGLGTLDLALHTDYRPERDGDAVEWVTDLLSPFSPGPSFAAAHPLPSFMHIFSGGYAASYYSYLWSAVLEADLFTVFQENGIFERETGRRYLETILSAGDRDDPDVLFRTFMGRGPDPEALIRRNLGEAA
ncbi:MAG: M3 family peptidase [Gemmatimonadetes bacterium]|nr:M3 family peptidase [Gemmatimonadota bacterium]